MELEFSAHYSVSYHCIKEADAAFAVGCTVVVSVRACAHIQNAIQVAKGYYHNSIKMERFTEITIITSCIV